MFWTSTSEFESRLESTEAKLLQFAQLNHHTENALDVVAFDTFIPRSAVPCLKPAKNEDDKLLKIHGIKATSNGVTDDLYETGPFPLVNLHGYMNAGAYFYRNVGALCNYFPSVYAIDMLGWGLSSRPPFHEVEDNGSIESAEAFFVESLEAWRSENNIDKMVLSGHSFGGYVAVAYTERYPERVDRLILLSPFGVPNPEDPASQWRLNHFRSTWTGQAIIAIFQMFFNWTTPGGVIRSFTESRGSLLARSYVARRLPQIKNVEESEALADYLYMNAKLPPSGEFFLRTLFTDTMMAKNPLVCRIPNLKVKSVNFMYGTTDWMDISGGMDTEALCYRLSQDDSSLSIPKVNVYSVPNAGHLLTLHNPVVVSAGIIRIAGGSVRVPEQYMPILMDLDASKEVDESTLRAAREILSGECEKRIG